MSDKGKVAILFAGCGWMHPFEFGAGKAFAEMIDLKNENVILGGCSAGAVVASCLAVGMDIDEFFEQTLTIYDSCKILPFRMCDGVKKVLQRMTPGDEQWRQASGKLVVGLSAVCYRGLTSEHVSEFHDAAHAIEIIRASCHLPLVGGLLPYYIKGHRSRYYDGGITTNVPEIPDVFKITIDGRPTVDGLDIVPNLGFTVPFTWVYFPRNPTILRLLYRLGYLRTLEFLSSEAVINKTKHVLNPQYVVLIRTVQEEIAYIVAKIFMEIL